MIYNVFLSRAAVADIEQAIKWYENQREALGYEFELSIEAGVTYLQRNPLHSEKKYGEIHQAFSVRDSL